MGAVVPVVTHDGALVGMSVGGNFSVITAATAIIIVGIFRDLTLLSVLVPDVTAGAVLALVLML
jgi:hypothetical protein